MQPRYLAKSILLVIEVGAKLMVIPRLFKVANCMVLKKISCIDEFGWLFSSNTIITSRFDFIDSRSQVFIIN